MRNPVLLAVRLFTLFAAAARIVVAMLVDADSAALEADLGLGEATITRVYEHRVGTGSSATERRADVQLLRDGSELELRVDLAVDAGELVAGDRIAVAYQRANPSNNRVGPDVEALLTGAITPEAYFERLRFPVNLAFAAGGVFALIAVGSFLPKLLAARCAAR